MVSHRFEFRTAPGWRLGVIGLATLVMLVCALWAWAQVERGEPLVALLALAGLPAAAWAVRLPTRSGVLRDEGGTWWLDPGPPGAEAVPGDLRVAFDLDRAMLLRFEPETGRASTWLALSSSDMPATWPAFRRAVYSPRIAPAGPSAQASADPPA